MPSHPACTELGIKPSIHTDLTQPFVHNMPMSQEKTPSPTESQPSSTLRWKRRGLATSSWKGCCGVLSSDHNSHYCLYRSNREHPQSPLRQMKTVDILPQNEGVRRIIRDSCITPQLCTRIYDTSKHRDRLATRNRT